MYTLLNKTLNKIDTHPLRKGFYFIPFSPHPKIKIDDIFLSKLEISKDDSKYVKIHKKKIYRYFSNKYGEYITEEPLYWYFGCLFKATIFLSTGLYIDNFIFIFLGLYQLLNLPFDGILESGTERNMMIKYREIEE